MCTARCYTTANNSSDRFCDQALVTRSVSQRLDPLRKKLVTTGGIDIFLNDANLGLILHSHIRSYANACRHQNAHALHTCMQYAHTGTETHIRTYTRTHTHVDADVHTYMHTNRRIYIHDIALYTSYIPQSRIGARSACCCS